MATEADHAAGAPARDMRKTSASFLARLGLALLALWLLSVAEHRYEVFHQDFAAFFRFDFWLWAAWVGAAALSGLAFGLAAWLPFGRLRYRWSRLALVLVPLLPLIHYWAYWNAWFTGRSGIEGWLTRPYSVDAIGPIFALAVLVGVALAAGFRPAPAGQEPA